MNKKTRSQKRPPTLIVYLLICLSLVPVWLQAQIGNFVSTIPSILVAGTAGAARGGILISIDNELKKAGVKQVAYDTLEHNLIARLGTGQIITVPLSNLEISELTSAIKRDKDGLLEISIDPVADKTENYISPELDSTIMGIRLLMLDSDIAELFEGGFQLTETVSGGVPIPADEVFRLLNPQAGDTSYQSLVAQFVAPPTSWHSTIICVSISNDSAYLPIKLTVDPTPVFATADGRRLHPTNKQKKIATRPYLSLQKRFEQHPDLFVNTMPNLAAGLRYARAFALLAVCRESQTCQWQLPVLAAPPAETIAQALQGWRDSRQNNRILAKRGKIQTAWRNYRLTIDPSQLNSAQRVAFFVDEAFAYHRSLTSAQELAAIYPMSADTLLRIIKGVDLEKERYGGWAYLAKFLIGVWQGLPPHELVETMRQAYDRALKDYALATNENDREETILLKYHILRVTEDLIPVMKSNLFVAEMQGQKLKPVKMPYGSKGVVQEAMEPREYLDYMEAYVNDVITDHMVAVFDRIRIRTDSLFDINGAVTAKKDSAMKVLSKFELSHLPEERRRIKHALLPDFDSTQVVIVRNFLLLADSLQKEMLGALLSKIDVSKYNLADSSQIRLFKLEVLRELLLEPVLFESGRLQYAIGLAAIKENNKDEALDRARMLDSYAKAADGELAYITAAELKKWSEQLRLIVH